MDTGSPAIGNPALGAADEFSEPLIVETILGSGNEDLRDQFLFERGWIKAGCGLDRPGHIHRQGSVADIEHDGDVGCRIEAASLAPFLPPAGDELLEKCCGSGGVVRVLDDDDPVIPIALCLCGCDRPPHRVKLVTDSRLDEDTRQIVGCRCRWQLGG